MSTFYILNFKVSSNAYIAEKVTLSDDSISDNYPDGISFKDKNVEITLHKNKGNLLHFIDNLYGLPIWSQEITTVIEEHCAKEIELYPVDLLKDKKQSFSFVNILNLVDVIDFENSDCTLWDPDIKLIDEVEKLILLEEKANNFNIFRMLGLKLEIVISEALKIKLEKLNINELEFIPVEDFKLNMDSLKW